MYTAHFGFQFDPFEPGYRPERYFDASQFRDAHEHLRSAIADGDKIMVLSGPGGSGKTTLLKQFLHSWNKGSQILFLEGEVGTFEDVVDYLFTALKLPASGHATGEKLNEIYHFLRNAEDASNQRVLIVDNADKLPAIAIKQISYLCQASKQGNLQILFVGSSRLEARFKDSVLAPTAEQVRHWIRLRYLSNEEVGLFVDHCLKQAGYKGTRIFSPAALESLVRYSAGNPRLIVNLCGFSLLSASIENAVEVTQAMIDEVATDCIFETESDSLDQSAGQSAGADASNLIPLIRKARNTAVHQSSAQMNANFDPARSEAVILRCRELGIPHPGIENPERNSACPEETNIP
ncbi:MAG: AAA family ATPase [Methylococcaceae bacterium]|nr:AAA family ATPase [Methylococcaceae bacterium]MCI0668537.1 AAA family ATPase [Methylococcaceae bacterium]MCI0732839.1 AAA family ATPase [Methylococcaceae bacterium]